MTLQVILVVLAALGSWFALTWNLLVRLRQHVRESWSGIETELRRRHDLVPNLTAVVAAAAAHERGVLTAVSQARAAALAARPDPQGKAENDLAAAVRDLLAVAEAVPQLQADRGFAALQAQLAETEDRIQAARRLFNGNVREYNTRIESFPARLIAPGLGFRRERYCEFEPTIRKVTSVSFPEPPIPTPAR